MKSKLEVYALAVCFAAVICLVISGGIGGYGLIEIIWPELTLTAHAYNSHQNNDEFWKSIYSRTNIERQPEQRPAEEDVTKLRLESYSRLLAFERRDGAQNLLKYAIFFLAGAIAYFVHWRIARQARQEVST